MHKVEEKNQEEPQVQSHEAGACPAFPGKAMGPTQLKGSELNEEKQKMS